MEKKYIGSLSLSVILLLSSAHLSATSADKTKEGNTVNITLPKVPTPPKAPSVNAKVIPAVEVRVNGEVKSPPVQEESKKSGILFSKRVPPVVAEAPKPKAVSKKGNLVGDVSNSRLCAYLRAPLLSKGEVISKLEDDFIVLASYDLDKNADLTSIIFTNKEIRSAASKKTRGFAGTLRLLIDEKNGFISITNPMYMMKAFMQDEYKQALAVDTLEKINDAFDGLKPSKDILKVSGISNYQFMLGLPTYEDMTEVASAPTQVLLKKAYQSKKVVYEQTLSNGSIVVGIKLSDTTRQFINTIGTANAALLPYPILIENNKAKILAPKYYIAVMYPMLSMSEFMAISSTPGEIEKECDQIFR